MHHINLCLNVWFFRLAFFELTFQFRTTQQLQWEVVRHYSKQVACHVKSCRVIYTEKSFTSNKICLNVSSLFLLVKTVETYR